MPALQTTLRPTVPARSRNLRYVFQLLGAAGALFCLYWLLIFTFAIIVPRQTNAELVIAGECHKELSPNTLTILIWNLGYAGTGAEAAFFMDGGRDVMAKDKPTVLRHLSNITNVLRERRRDIYLLQEVDSNSRRTYWLDEVGLVRAGLNTYCSAYGVNHDVPFVPYPYRAPLGRVRSGLLSFSAYTPRMARRYQLPGSLPWPDSAFHLQRCLLEWRLPRADGREWVIINTHLEAWDKGEVKDAELTWLRDKALQEYQAGNFVVIGGDWNAVMPGITLTRFATQDGPGPHTVKLREDIFPPAWRWALDRSRPSSRRCKTPYVPGSTYVTIIDGFVVSPNVQIDHVKTVPLGFQDSDHEPIDIRVHGPS